MKPRRHTLQQLPCWDCNIQRRVVPDALLWFTRRWLRPQLLKLCLWRQKRHKCPMAQRPQLFALPKLPASSPEVLSEHGLPPQLAETTPIVQRQEVRLHRQKWSRKQKRQLRVWHDLIHPLRRFLRFSKRRVVQIERATEETEDTFQGPFLVPEWLMEGPGEKPTEREREDEDGVSDREEKEGLSLQTKAIMNKLTDLQIRDLQIRLLRLATVKGPAEEGETLGDELIGLRLNEKELETDDEERSSELEEDSHVPDETSLQASPFTFMVPSALRPLSFEDRQKVDSVWHEWVPPDEPAVTASDAAVVSKKDLKLLQSSTWLNDEVVNAYLALIQDRNNLQLKTPTEGVPRVRVLSSFFYARLAGTTAGYDYSGVRRWTRKVDIFSLDKVLIPLNHHNTHWSFLVLDMRGSCLEFYDSLHGNCKALSPAKEHVMNMILAYLADEARDKKRPDFPRDTWSYKAVCSGVPQQGDGSSCGVFVCCYADLIARGAQPPFAFSQDDIPAIRKGIAAAILRGRIE